MVIVFMFGVAIFVLGVLIIDQNLRLIKAYETIIDLEEKVSQLIDGVLENLKKENREYHPTSVINKSASSGMDTKIGDHNG